jgi:hypothetical protein
MPKVEKFIDHDPNLDCGIAIVDATTADDGNWTCHTKDDIRQTLYYETTFTLSVVSPFKVSLYSPGKRIASLLLTSLH